MSFVAGHKAEKISQQEEERGWGMKSIRDYSKYGNWYEESHGRENSYDANDPVCYLKQGLGQADPPPVCMVHKLRMDFTFFIFFNF